MAESVSQKLGKVIKIDEDQIHKQLSELVRGTVEETLNKLLDAEADQLCNAARYERTDARRDTRAGHYKRGLHTKAGEVTLKVPKLRQHKFELAIIDLRRNTTQALWGTRVSQGTVSNLNKKIYKRIDRWRNRPLEVESPYVYLDGIVLKRTWADQVRNVSVLVAIGVSDDGYRQVLGVVEGAKEDKAGWSDF